MNPYFTQQYYMFPHEHASSGSGSYSAYHPGWQERDDDSFRAGYRRQFLGGDPRWANSDVSHIIASNNGGINAAENVFMFDSSMNRSISDSMHGQEINAALAGRNRACTAARVSRRHGSYDGPTGSVLHDRGSRYLEQQGILVRENGGIDRRSAAVRNGSLSLNKDGSIRANAAYKFWQ